MKKVPSIAVQILLAVLITVVVVLGIASLIELRILERREARQLHDRVPIAADRVANNLAYPLWNLNHFETERVVLDELAAPEIVGIQVLDEKDQLYLGKTEDSNGVVRDLASEKPTNNVPVDYTFTKEIRFRNNRIGSVRVDFSRAYLEPSLANLRWGIAVKLLLVVIVLSIVLYVALRLLVIRRLASLKSWIKGADTSASPPEFKFSEEFNSLAKSFGSLSGHLRQKHGELESEHLKLQELNRQLQEKIIEREMAEAALRESEKRFRQLTENINEVFWLYTPDFKTVLYISPTYERIWGKTTESLRENPYSFLDSVYSEDREWLEQVITTLRDTGFDVEYRIIKPDGMMRWIRDRGFPIKDEAGTLQRIAGIAEDITDRKQAQQDLRAYADRVRDLYNNAPCGYHSLDEDGVYVQINDTELNWLGLTRDDVIGKLSFGAALIPEDRVSFEAGYKDFLQRGSVKDAEYRLIPKDGFSRTVLLSATSSKNADDKFVMSRATLYDISDRRRAEERVERSEEKFARAFRASPVGLAVTRLSDGKFIELNDASTRFLGYAREELIGRTTIELAMWPKLEDRQAVITELRETGSVRGKELSFRTKEGKFVLCEYSAEMIEVGGESCLLSVLLDITERRHIEQELKANEELLRLFVKHTPAAIAMFDTQMRYLQVSDRFLTDYHLDGQDIIGRLHYDVFPNLPERWKEVHRRILAGAVEHNDEDPYIEADGSQGWLQWESLPWRKADGEIGGLILFTQVITERKRAEQALKASEERFAKIFNLSPYRMGIVRISDGVILDVNDCWVGETGFSKEEIVNHVIYDLGQWLTEAARVTVRKIIAEKKPIRGLEGVLKTKSGELRYALSSATIVDFDGEPCYLWAAHDITDRKLVEEDRRKLIHELGERVKELTALQQTARILQDETKTPAQLLQSIVSILPAAWQYPHITAARISFGTLEFKTENFAASQWSQVREFSDGYQKGQIEVVYTEERQPADIGPFLSEELSLINSVAEMISSALNQRYAQKALKEREELFRNLAENVRALSARMQSAREEEGTRIAREIHDELGGALTGIKWDLEGIESKLEVMNGNSAIPDVRKQLKAITTQIESTIDTVRRISSELRPGVLDDLGLVAAIEWQGQQFQKRTGLKVHWETVLDTADVSRERATAVFRIFQEVLTNVLRHSRASNIYVKLEQLANHLELEVADDGRGITEDEQRNTQSLGILGMKERALLVGGEVRINGSDGKGTTVIVTVPLSDESKSEAVA